MFYFERCTILEAVGGSPPQSTYLKNVSYIMHIAVVRPLIMLTMIAIFSSRCFLFCFFLAISLLLSSFLDYIILYTCTYVNTFLGKFLIIFNRYYRNRTGDTQFIRLLRCHCAKYPQKQLGGNLFSVTS